MNRRDMIRGAMGVAGASVLAQGCVQAVDGNESKSDKPAKGRLKQSIAYWCFSMEGDKWSLEKTCEVANQLGCESVELVNTAQELAVLKRYGLTCAILGLDMTPDPPFTKGFNNPDHWPKLFEQTKKGIDAASEYGCPNMVCFTGYSAKDPNDPNSEHLTPEQGAANCVRGFKEIVGYAEQKNVTLCLEPLNTRDTSHPMKGHPGYQGAHFDYCMDIIKRVGSSHLKLLFDIYHTQIMDGDIIRRIRDNFEFIGHIHTAGCPGRGELDDKQEIAYQPIMNILADQGYQGYVGHEFLPTRDPSTSLQEAVDLCTV
jgi:hydroxypyruvate isomerase